jgi:hypothetical protein
VLSALLSHTIACEQLMPVFLSTPASDEPVALPFKFVGGFALSTRTIGLIMSGQGVYSMLAQMFVFPKVVDRLGPLRLFRGVVIVWPLLYLVVPYVVLLPAPYGLLGVGAILAVKVLLQVCAYPSNQMMISNSTPSMLNLGIINGVGASAASLARAFGPTFSGLLHSVGIERGYSGLAWWVAGAVSLLGAMASLWLQDIDARHGLRSGGATEDFGVVDLEPCLGTSAVPGAIEEPVVSRAASRLWDAHARSKSDVHPL